MSPQADELGNFDAHTAETLNNTEEKYFCATQLTNEFAQIRWAGIYVKTGHIKRAAFWTAL